MLKKYVVVKARAPKLLTWIIDGSVVTTTSNIMRHPVQCKKRYI